MYTLTYIMKKIISFLFFLLIIYGLFVLSITLILEFSPRLTEDLIINASVAFFSAFFVFFFITVGGRAKDIRKRNTDHYNALVRSEYILNKAIGALDSNIKMYKDSIQRIKRGKLLTYMNYNILFDNEFIHSLKNVDAKNDFFIFFQELEYKHIEIKAVKDMYYELKKAYLDKSITEKFYLSNCSVCIQQMALQSYYFSLYKEKAIRLLAITRILFKEKSKKSFLFGLHVRNKYPKNIEGLITAETMTVKKEIGENLLKHQKDLERIKKDIISAEDDVLKLKENKENKKV